jgi:excisionase family DNA binding protein
VSGPRSRTKTPKTAEGTVLLTIPETADQLRCSENTVYRRIASGELEARDISRPGAKKSKTRVPRESLLAYLQLSPAATSQISD